MEVTPVKPLAETSRGSRHTPTPKMSERKRSLFGRCNTANLFLSIDEDSDLGPMSPIRYSPVEEEEPTAGYTFRNILMMKPATPEVDDMSNMSSVISDQAVNVPASPLEMTTEEEGKENRPEEAMKTPEVDKQSYCRDLRISFKKSLILGDISIPQALVSKGSRKWLTKLSDEESPHDKAPKPEGDGEPLKAKTSLSFEMPAISPMRFYTPEVSKANRRVIFTKNPATTGRRFVRGAKRVGLINKGVGHKIAKPSRKAIVKAGKEKVAEERKKELKVEISASQIERINAIVKNAKNPLEMCRPLPAKPESSDEEEEEEVDVVPSNRKFFKSGMKRTKKSLTLINTLSATVEGGRVALVAPKRRKKAKTETFEDMEEESFCDQQEVKGIISQLTAVEEKEVDGIIAKIQSDPMDEFRQRIPYQTTDPVVVERQKAILELLITNNICSEETFKVFISEPEAHKVQAAKILDEMFLLTTEPKTEEVFPIFKKDFKPGGFKSPGTLTRNQGVRRLWRPIGAGQLQIDAGQKEFGAKLCTDCNLVYSVHEPEEERLHLDFHNALGCINFRGWQEENVVLTVSEWGAGGRVLCVQSTDSRAKVNRVERLLEVIDEELGAYRRPMPAKAITYLAVAHYQIMGVCVAEPIYWANRLVQRNGVDYFSEEDFPAHCGILKLWTALPFRGQGVARELLTAVRKHFVFGHVLSWDEIAFSSPTEAGRSFAQKMSGRIDCLVYP